MELTFPALRFPHPWPPPPEPAAGRWERRLRRIPVLGPIAAYLLRRRRFNKHFRESLLPIAAQIAEQLEQRSTKVPWPETDEQRRIARYISEAICLEKCLDSPPPLHPDDPTELIFWGPFDDISFMIVYFKLKEQFQYDIRLHEWSCVLQKHRNLRELFEHLIERLAIASVQPVRR